MNPDPLQEEEFLYEPRMLKKVVLQEREDYETTEETSINFYYNPAEREIDFGRSINEFFNAEYNNIRCCQVFYYDSSTKYYTFLGLYPFEKQVLIKYEDFQDDTIYIRYQPKCDQEDEEQETKPKKHRVKERTIKEVLKLVAEWRDIHSSKKCKLELAAQEVGLPKKTLDDYYQQIKLAETYEFDFEKYLNEGVGVLRKFVKEKHEKKKAVELNILKKYTEIVEKKKEEPDDSSEEE